MAQKPVLRGEQFTGHRITEFLRKGAGPDADLGMRVGGIVLAKDCKEIHVHVPDEVAVADELFVTQRQSKADQDWSGSEVNAFVVASDARVCSVSWIKHLVGLRPEHFDYPSSFLFALSDGKVLREARCPRSWRRQRHGEHGPGRQGRAGSGRRRDRRWSRSGRNQPQRGSVTRWKARTPVGRRARHRPGRPRRWKAKCKSRPWRSPAARRASVAPLNSLQTTLPPRP